MTERRQSVDLAALGVRLAGALLGGIAAPALVAFAWVVAELDGHLMVLCDLALGIPFGSVLGTVLADRWLGRACRVGRLAAASLAALVAGGIGLTFLLSTDDALQAWWLTAALAAILSVGTYNVGGPTKRDPSS
jgi:hypothetical protein